MKKILIKPLAVMALATTVMFGCASSEEAGYDDTEVLETEAEVVEESPLLTSESETEELSNETIAYENIFEDIEETERYDVVTLVKMDPNFSTFASLLERSGLEPSLKLMDPVTVFLPTNEAFEEMEREQFLELTDSDNIAVLTQFVKMHILPTKVYEGEFDTTQIIETEAENEIPVTTRMNGAVIYVGGAEIIKPDVVASNGLIHVVNSIIQPGDFTDVTAD